MWIFTSLVQVWMLSACVRCLCCRNESANENDFSHISHLKAFSSLWLSRWFLSLLENRKDFPQTSHLYCLSPWIRTCFFRWGRRVNVFSHMSHLCGFSPTWVLWCVWRACGKAYDFPQTSHLWGFSPVWIMRWSFQYSRREKDFPQVSHLCGFSALCTTRCFFSSSLKKNDFSHASHL